MKAYNLKSTKMINVDNVYVYSRQSQSYADNHKNQVRISEKRIKYIDLHNKRKYQSKLFRKRYEIEKSLEKKEEEANSFCNIFNNKYDDNKCIDICEDIEYLEQKLKNIEMQIKII